jgi:kynurenine formamidase
MTTPVMILGECILVDLSVSLGPNNSEHVPVSVHYLPHDCGGAHLAELTGVRQEDLCGGLGWASERITAITHSGTHVDAPFHYAPQCSGAPSRTIDVMPLEWFLGEAVCIDASRGEEEISVEEVLAFEAQRAAPIAAGTIVLFHTGAARHYGSTHYGECGRAIAAEVVEFLCERGVRLIGTDAWSIDPPLSKMRARAVNEGAGSVWRAHYVGVRREFCVVEKLTNLERLPASGFSVICFPIKVACGSAGWTRAVAVVPAARQRCVE